MDDEAKPPVHYTAPVPVSVDLSRTHLQTIHVVAIVAAIMGAGIAVAKTYISVTSQVEQLAREQNDRATTKDLETLRTNLSSDMTHAASDRVKFYMEHAKLECDPAARGHKQNCRLIWPVPDGD